MFREVVLACASQKTHNFYGPEKSFVKLRPAYSVKLVFLFVVKGIKIKINAKFCDTEHFRSEDTKKIMSPEKFRVFRETGPWALFAMTVPKTCAHTAISKNVVGDHDECQLSKGDCKPVKKCGY